MQVMEPPREQDEERTDEAALVAGARDDPECFGRLYDRYVLRIYRYAYRRLGSHQDAEDLTAQTFRRALEGLDRFAWQGAPFGAWLFRIAHNLLVDRYRRVPPVSLDGNGEASEPADPMATLPEEAVLAREEADGVWAAVATLPELQRRAVVLRFGRDMSHAEVGAIIGRSEAATKQLVYRAVKTLRSRLAEAPAAGAVEVGA